MQLGHLFEGVAKVILEVTLLPLCSTLLVCLLFDSNVVQLMTIIPVN